ncbi:hypothetical protein [Aromatoleum petrolei]|uniref:Uncharacterized protein n=1 Tax=Aromatoleum petrolei TaxID=76116 RepID=A0ABX1MKX6_9RHOO|nr:hypothetical protein [Aromatoleum petrolei]NMF87015.1 hypothetical protein [Aromatoleum petrolei]QTQ34749.1 Putative transposase, IS110 family [Aromatoleum petrolei]
MKRLEHNVALVTGSTQGQCEGIALRLARDTHGKTVVMKQLSDQVVLWFANLRPSLIGMETCGGAHCWA